MSGPCRTRSAAGHTDRGSTAPYPFSTIYSAVCIYAMSARARIGSSPIWAAWSPPVMCRYRRSLCGSAPNTRIWVALQSRLAGLGKHRGSTPARPGQGVAIDAALSDRGRTDRAVRNFRLGLRLRSAGGREAFVLKGSVRSRGYPAVMVHGRGPRPLPRYPQCSPSGS